MALKSSIDPYGDSILVDRYINTSYDTVKLVADDIVNVNLVAGDIVNISAAGAAAASFVTVAGDIADVNTVATDIADVNSVATEIGNGNIALVIAAPALTDSDRVDADNARIASESARDSSITAKVLSETAQGLSETAKTASENAQAYSEEWAETIEDTAVSIAAGGDGLTTFSSLHHAAKADASSTAAAASETNAQSAVTGNDFYDISIQDDSPSISSIIFSFITIRSFDLPINLLGSLAFASTAPTADTILSIQNNGVEFGTLTFLNGDTTGTFVASTLTNFVMSDNLTVVTPGVLNSLSGISINLNGALTLIKSDYVDIAFYSKNVLEISINIVKYLTTRAFTFPIDLVGSNTKALVAGTSNVVFSLQKDGVEFATMTFVSGSLTATFNTISGTATSFAIGEKFDIVTPADLFSLSDVTVTLTGSL